MKQIIVIVKTRSVSCLYAKDPHKAKYQLLNNKKEMQA